MAAPGDTQGSALVGFGGPLKEIANLYNTTSSASTPSTKDLDQKEFISPVVAQLAQVLAEHLKGTMAAQTPGSASDMVPETPDSAIVSPGPTSQTREPLFWQWTVDRGLCSATKTLAALRKPTGEVPPGR